MEKCFHCGDDCGSYPVTFDEKNFCCNGCKSVYEILNGNKLYKYYQIDGSPGNKVETNIPKHKYAFLENKEILKKILDFSDNQTSKVTLFIPSIHCSSCIWLLENLNTLHSGIKLSRVNFTQKKVYITYNNSQVSLKEIAELLDSISYVPQINLEDATSKKEASKHGRKLVVKLGIAGFCFGNIMLLSFPEYFSAEATDAFVMKYFRWFNLVLSLPVFFYSSSEFFESAFKNLKKKIVNIDLPVAIGIVTIFLRSLYEILSGTGAGYMDSMTGLVFFLLIGRWYQNKTYKALSFDRGFQSYFPLAATVIRNNMEIPVPINEIKTGDLLVIRNKELIPVDAVLKEGNGNIDYSFVTGESVPVSKPVGELLYAGGRQVGNIITVEAIKKVSQSYFTQLWNQEMLSNKEKSITGIVDVISKYFIVIILFLATLAFVFWSFKDPTKAFDSFTAILIIACPCALALSAPFTYGAAMRIFARSGLFMRDIHVVEDLSKIDTIVFDKTGTITKNNIFDIEFHGEKLTPEEEIGLKSVIRHSSHPLSLAVFYHLENTEIKDIDVFEEITGMGIKGNYKNIEYKIGSPEFTNLKSNNIANPGSIVSVSINNKTKGYFELKNHYREGLSEILDQLKINFKLHLLSGDNDAEKIRLEKHFSNLRFNQKPEDKLNYISDLQKSTQNVMMIGDGLNDAGALKNSNVGISLADNVYQFSPACDAILNAENFQNIDKYLKFSKTAIKILYFSFAISFFYNIIGLSYAFSGKLEPVIAAILMPISSVTVVAFASLAVYLAAKAKKII